jgi:hypothetical protein
VQNASHIRRPSIDTALWQFAPPAAGLCALSAAEGAQKASRSPHHATHRAAHRPELVHRAQRRAPRANSGALFAQPPTMPEVLLLSECAFSLPDSSDFGQKLRAALLDASRPLRLTLASAAKRTRSVDCHPAPTVDFLLCSRPSSESAAITRPPL